MAKRSLEELQKRYASAAAADGGRGPGGMHGPGPRRPMGEGGKGKYSRATVQRLLSYIAVYRGRIILALVFMVINTLTALAGTFLLRDVINVVNPRNTDPAKSTVVRLFMPWITQDTFTQQRLNCLVMVAAVLAVVYLVGILTSYLQNRLMVTVSQNATERLRNDLFRKLQHLPVRYFDANTTGELMSRFTNDIDAIDNMINSTVTSLISGAISLVGTLIMMLYLNIWLTLITLAFIPLFLFSGKAIAKRSGRYYSAQQAALGAVNGYIEESVSGTKVVKVFNHEGVCVEEFESLNNDMREKQFRAQFYGGVMGPVMNNSSNIAYAITAGVGGILCLTTGFDVGGLTAFCNASRQFSFPINNISMQMSNIFSALAGAERVFTVMDQKPEEPDCPDAMPMPAPGSAVRGEVVLDDVTFGYVPEHPVLKHVSLYAHAGQKIAFVGSTGAGKTTVTNLLNRFYDIQEGTITIDGVDIRHWRREDLRANIAMVLQDTHLFTGTIMENIRYGRPDATDEEVIQAAKAASAHSFIMRLSKGYQTELTGDGANLSQGQRQLLNIARASLSKAPILVLDEATSSVDTRTERLIEEGMNRLMQNRTTFIIAHRLSTVRNANAILVLEHGEIMERGNHEQLLALRGRYYELYTGAMQRDLSPSQTPQMTGRERSAPGTILLFFGFTVCRFLSVQLTAGRLVEGHGSLLILIGVRGLLHLLPAARHGDFSGDRDLGGHGDPILGLILQDGCLGAHRQHLSVHVDVKLHREVIRLERPEKLQQAVQRAASLRHIEVELRIGGLRCGSGLVLDQLDRLLQRLRQLIDKVRLESLAGNGQVAALHLGGNGAEDVRHADLLQRGADGLQHCLGLLVILILGLAVQQVCQLALHLAVQRIPEGLPVAHEGHGYVHCLVHADHADVCQLRHLHLDGHAALCHRHDHGRGRLGGVGCAHHVDLVSQGDLRLHLQVCLEGEGKVACSGVLGCVLYGFLGLGAQIGHDTGECVLRRCRGQGRLGCGLGGGFGCGLGGGFGCGFLLVGVAADQCGQRQAQQHQCRQRQREEAQYSMLLHGNFLPFILFGIQYRYAVCAVFRAIWAIRQEAGTLSFFGDTQPFAIHAKGLDVRCHFWRSASADKPGISWLSERRPGQSRRRGDDQG